MNPEPDQQEIQRLQQIIREQAKRIAQLEEELRRFKELLDGKAQAKAAKKPKFSENYSLGHFQKTRSRKRKPKRKAGRVPHQAKRTRDTKHEKIFPEGVPKNQCVERRLQFVWRLIDGKAVSVCYHIYDLPNSRNLPLPPGVRNSRCEYGLEIILSLAHLHYWTGVSLDHACEILEFFTGLKLAKSQADSLLNQLAKDWDGEYETITQLIALQMIVYIDETGWKVGAKSCYTWVFSTAMYVLFRCGVSRKKEEAQKVLGASFEGIGVSDDYAAYQNLFTQHQLCWAHLLRKAIKLALQYPDHPEYAEFLDELCSIYHEAKRCQADGRLSTGRAAKVEQLQYRLQDLCSRYLELVTDETPGHLATFLNLQRELVFNTDYLFVFVAEPEVEATNNRAERDLRREAEIRKGARTSKSRAGAKRRGIILTIFSSLRTRLTKFTISSLLEEVIRWTTDGCSLFQQELSSKQATSSTSGP